MPERLRYSPQAQLDLDEIYDYFADELNDPDRGQAVVSDILSAAEKIPGRATRFPPVEPLPFTDDVYRFVNVGNYLAFFRTTAGVIYIDRVLHKRRDFASLLGL